VSLKLFGVIPQSRVFQSLILYCPTVLVLYRIPLSINYTSPLGGAVPVACHINTFPLNYRPEPDTTPELTPDQASFYQSQIGVLRWCVELGRVDIITEVVSELASYLALPRQGHLEAVFHLFNFLEKRHNARIVFDPSYPTIEMGAFKECDWKAFYGNVQEAIPPNAPVPKGKDVDLRLFVDSDHAGDQHIRRSRKGFLIYLNSAPITWFSKKQSTIETSGCRICCYEAGNGNFAWYTL
jgi:hypothetical protein